MERFRKIINQIATYSLIIAIGILLVIVYFKNIKIEHLNKQLAEKPKIEYVYDTKTDTIYQDVVVPKTTVKYVDRVTVETDTAYIPLSQADSLQIAQAYIRLFQEYNSTNEYDDVLKDDSLAYIRLKESVSRNEISGRQLTYQDRTPVVNITTKVPETTTSIIGGIEAGNSGVEIGAGLVTKRNAVYKVSYDPFNKKAQGAVYLPIFNFRK